MTLGTELNRVRDRLVANLATLRGKKQEAQALIQELNPLIADAQTAIDEFDVDVALIPNRIKNR